MALKEKQKKYIHQNHKKITLSEMARVLKVPEDDIKNYLASRQREHEPSPLKKVIFTLITLLIPILFFVLAETGLRFAGYGQTDELFIFPERHEGTYGQLNPEYHEKFFTRTSTFTAGRGNVFLAEKPDNGFRVFVLGASTAESFPYGFNGLFSLVLEDMLRDVLPDRHVEVVNIGITATNTYTLYDQIRGLRAQKPDAILIYSGQNEYYGAMGVASTERIALFPGLVRFYLRLQRLALFQFFQDLIGRAATAVSGEERVDEEGILMERMVRENMIPLNSRLYRAGINQYESNLSVILRKWQKEGVPVFISSLASNLKDHPPFLSIETDAHPRAEKVFNEAMQDYDEGRYEEALHGFRYARDLDALRFRAPSALNSIIRDKAETYGAIYVPTKERMSEAAGNGIIGFDLMLEHLHPNSDGYFIMAESFFEQLMAFPPSGINPDKSLLKESNHYHNIRYLTDLDHQIVDHRVRVMRNSWPFTTGRNPSGYPFNYQPVNTIDEIAYKHVMEELEWHEAKIAMTEYYSRQGQHDKALDEVRGIIKVVPYERDPWLFAAGVALEGDVHSVALNFLEKAHEIRPDAVTYAQIGRIEATSGNHEKGGRYMEQAYRLNRHDVSSLYRAAVAYGADENFDKALALTRELEQHHPDFPMLDAWKHYLKQVMTERGLAVE